MQEETESQRGQETFPSSHRRKQGGKLKPRSLDAQISLRSSSYFLESGQGRGWGQKARRKESTAEDLVRFGLARQSTG